MISKSKSYVQSCELHFSDYGQARNVLFFTLLLDDRDGKKSQLIWNTYYHTMLDTESLNLLSSQAQKLESLATSTQEWHEGPYGGLLRFCNSSTFMRVVRLRKFYAVRPSQKQDFRDQQQKLKTAFEKAQNHRKEVLGQYTVLTGVRSAFPCAILALADMAKLASEYWKTGVAVSNKDIPSESTHHHPMFAVLSSTQILHYGMDPHLGSHMATSCAPLAKESQLDPRLSNLEGLTAAVKAAMSEFQAWGESFRNARGQLLIRFMSSDALGFCHVLQHH